jgi:hypothetical protein
MSLSPTRPSGITPDLCSFSSVRDCRYLPAHFVSVWTTSLLGAMRCHGDAPGHPLQILFGLRRSGFLVTLALLVFLRFRLSGHVNRLGIIRQPLRFRIDLSASPIWDNSDSLRFCCLASFCPRLACCCFCGLPFSERFDFADIFGSRLLSN